MPQFLRRLSDPMAKQEKPDGATPLGFDDAVRRLLQAGPRRKVDRLAVLDEAAKELEGRELRKKNERSAPGADSAPVGKKMD